MAIFAKGKLAVISDEDDVDLSRASINRKLSAVDYDDDDKFFYMTIDRAMFSDPVSTIRTVLDAHGFVPNLENILSCLDSFNFSVHTRVSANADSETSTVKVQDYMPCIRFEMPQKNKVGSTLKSYYDEIAKYESKATDAGKNSGLSNHEAKKNQGLKAQVEALKSENKELKEQVNALTYQLGIEQKSLSRASKALDSQRVLPDNAKICRVDSVDLKQRKIKVKCNRTVFEIPTHLLDRVPAYQARCLVTFDEADGLPIGIVFLDREEYANLEKRTADLLYVNGNSFKARDSLRNEFQIRAVNSAESETIGNLSRGMKVVISISDHYVVRFSVLGAKDSGRFKNQVHEQFIVHDIARNQLVARSSDSDQD